MRKLWIIACGLVVLPVTLTNAMDPQTQQAAIQVGLEELVKANNFDGKPTSKEMKKEQDSVNNDGTFKLNSRGCCTHWQKEPYKKEVEGFMASHHCVNEFSFDASNCPEGAGCCCVDFCAIFCWHSWICHVKNGRCYIANACSECLPYDEEYLE